MTRIGNIAVWSAAIFAARIRRLVNYSKAPSYQFDVPLWLSLFFPPLPRFEVLALVNELLGFGAASSDVLPSTALTRFLQLPSNDTADLRLNDDFDRHLSLSLSLRMRRYLE